MEYSILPRYVTDDPSMRPTAFLLDHNAQPTESDVPQAQLPSSFNPNPTFESQSWIHEPPQVTESASADSAPRVVPPRLFNSISKNEHELIKPKETATDITLVPFVTGHSIDPIP